MNRLFEILCQLVVGFIILLQIGQTESESKKLSPAQVLSDCLITRFNKCYSVFDEFAVSYDIANITCQRQKGKLAAITNEYTQKFIMMHFISQENKHQCNSFFTYNTYCRVWFDLSTQLRYSKEFFTSDGILSNYSNWKHGQPNLYSPFGILHGMKYCGAYSATSGLWYDDNCQFERNYFLCEREGTPCNAKIIQIPNAIFEFCNDDKLLPMNTIIRIKCNDGYEMLGDRHVVCKRDGTWTKFPSCQKVCPLPVLFPHSSIFRTHKKAYYNVGESNLILCDSGYVLETDVTRSHFVITCTHKENWIIAKCVPMKSFQVISREMIYGEKVELECKIKKSLIPKHWQKNSQLVTAEDGYTTVSEGTLKISRFQPSHEGIYTCLSMSLQISVGMVFYELKRQSLCLNISNSSDERDTDEGNSLILNCPHAGLEESAKSVTWIKDGKTFVQSERVFFVPDGSLIFETVAYSDMGHYSCDVSWDSGRCTSRISTYLTVTAPASSMCGNTLLMTSSPWTVSLYVEDDRTPFCYGALIHEKWVITSAYCISRLKKSYKLFVRFGQELLGLDELPGQGNFSEPNKIRYVEYTKTHPEYAETLLVNDLALVKLKEQVIFTEDIQPVCLTDKDLTKTCTGTESVQGVVSGWGYFDVENHENTEIQTERLSVLSPKVCLLTADYSDAIFCATRSTKDVISAGRVGSPFVVTNKNKVYLLGLFILGERHSHLGNNTYFTQIFKYMSWIRKTIG